MLGLDGLAVVVVVGREVPAVLVHRVTVERVGIAALIPLFPMAMAPE